MHSKVSKLVPILFGLSLVHAVPGFAGSDSLQCETKGGGLVVSAGNGGETALFRKNAGNSPALELPASVGPSFVTDFPAQLVFAPVGASKNVLDQSVRMKITHVNGETCYGRDLWDVRFQQEFLVMGRDGRGISSLIDGTEFKPNVFGYLSVKMNCRRQGASTSGGCFVDDENDVIEYEPIVFGETL